MLEQVVLVDEKDCELGTMEKLEAHRKGILHRAFSVFIFNDDDQMLLQQRALDKYHSAGLWTNACCSHPRPGESSLSAAHRRLKEEMGLETELNFKTSFIYRSAFENGLIEHEFDHVFVGKTNALPQPNPAEVSSYKWLSISEVKKLIIEEPNKFTTWFKIAIKDLF
jgi:isopentenyl-diphosphate delta-isomerase